MSGVPGTGAQYEDFLIDSGSTSHWASSLDMFTSFDYHETVFNLADNNQTVTSVGTGDIQFTTRTINDKLLKITIRGVHHSPAFQNNILSVDCLLEDGFSNPDFTRRILTAGEYRFQLLPREEQLQPVWRVRPVHQQQAQFSVAATTSTSSSRDVTDWRWITCEYLKYSRLTAKNPNGLCDTDCCSSDTNHQTVNVAHYTLRDPYQAHCLAGYSNYCNPVYTHSEITKFLTKAAADFDLDPEHTSFLLVLPHWPQAPWWPLTRDYQEMHRYGEGANILTAPRRGTYNQAQLRPAAATEGPDRVHIQGTPWPVSVFFRDAHTLPSIDDTMLLHLRFGHLGARHLIHLLDSGVVTGLQPSRTQLLAADPLCSCAPCRLAKASRPGPHPARDPSSQSGLNSDTLRMSSDLIGPVEPRGYDGTRYLMGFHILNFSFSTAFSIPTKDQALVKIEKFIRWLKMQPFVKKFTSMRLHLDNDTVFTSDAFKKICEENHIMLTWAAPYVAQTNSRIEVVWRDSSRMALAYLIQSGLDYKYWPLAFHHAIMIRNITPQRQLNFNIPYALAYGTLPDLRRIRIFGCTAFAWIPDAHRKKLDDKSIEMRYVGHKDLHGSPHQYLLLNLETGGVRGHAEPAFREALDKQAKQLRQADLAGMLPTLLTQFGRDKPAPWSLGIISKRGRRVLDLGVYYDEEDHEHIATVQFVSDSHPRGSWTSARHYLNSGNGAYEHLTEFIRHAERLDRVSSLYPLFATVEARVHHHYEPGIIVAVDVSRKDFPDTAYTIAPAKDGGDDFIDVDVSRVRLAASARGGSASAALAPLPPPTTPTSRSLDYVPFYENYVGYKEPKTLAQARCFPDAKHWEAAVKSELDSLTTKGCLHFKTKLPADIKPLDTRWVFKLKMNADGGLDKYKARLVAKGFLQIEGIDYTDTFAPGTQLTSFRIMLILAANYNLKITHLDVKTAFLNSDLKETIYVRLPEGAQSPDGQSVARLHKSIYGLKQAGHDWYQCSEKFILEHDKRTKRSLAEPCLYFLFTKELQVFILVHVDDYIIASSSELWTSRFTTAFNNQYGVNVLGTLSHFMQMSVTYGENENYLSQQRAIEELQKTYALENIKNNTTTPMLTELNLDKLDDCDTTFPYRSLLGSLLWIARCTRPDIYFAVTYLSQFNNCYGQVHFAAAKRVLKYLISTKTKKLVLPKIKHKQLNVTVFSDSDWAGDRLDRKSVTGTAVLLNGAPVSWMSKKQSVVATSSTEAEYIAASESLKEMLYTYNLLKEFTTVECPIYLHIDNTGAICISEKNINNQRTKHIDVRYHHIRDWVQSKVVKIEKVKTLDNTADIFTKSLPTQLHHHHAATFVRE